MKKFIKGMILVALLASLCLPVACSGGGLDIDTKTTYALSYFDGSSEGEAYDTELLYKNNSDYFGGDSGVIWVSEEENAEYGGYFYQYMSGCAGVSETLIRTDSEGVEYAPQVVISRSKDLNDWEICGALDGGFGLKTTDWALPKGGPKVFAPETIYDKTSGKYLMYFSAPTIVNDGSVEGALYSDNKDEWLQRQCIGVGVSDTPVGPFELATSENYYGDANAKDKNGQIVDTINPTILYAKAYPGCNINLYDAHPFVDADGTMYLHGTSSMTTAGYAGGNQCWMLKMKDPITPDYTSLTKTIGYFNIVTTEYKGKDYVDPDNPDAEFPNDPAYPRYLDSSWTVVTTFDDGTENKLLQSGVLGDSDTCNGGGKVNEAPQMLTTKDKNGKTVYLLTYTPQGVQAPHYDVKWAYSYSPMGPFKKPKDGNFAKVLGLDVNNDFMTNLGHVQFLKLEDEWWIVHWEWLAPMGSYDMGRLYALSPMTWIDVDGWDFQIPVANGPCTTYQRLPAIVTGYGNVGARATVSASGGEQKTVQYLNDNLFVNMLKDSPRQYVGKNTSTITLKFDKPTKVRGILVHNAYEYENAFKSIDNIVFKLASPKTIGESTYKQAVIQGLKFPASAYKEADKWIQAGAAAVATFDEIEVTEIVLEFSSAGMMVEGKDLHIGEIEVLGK